MKKILLSAVILASSIAAFAQNDKSAATTNQTCTEQTQNCNNPECPNLKDGNCTKDGKYAKKGKGKKDGKFAKGRKDGKGYKQAGLNKNDRKDIRKDRDAVRDSLAFAGITLTADQQNKLTNLRENARAQREAFRAEAKANKEANKADMNKENKNGKRAEGFAKRREARKNYLNGVKEILTPEQYVVFLENVYMMPQQGPRMDKANLHKAKAGKDSKKSKGERREMKDSEKSRG